MKTHRELHVWHKSMQLVVEIYKLVKLLPKEETYALSDQMRRSAISIPSNIAEGNARGSEKDFLRFLYISQGSCAELETQLLICQQLGYIPSAELENALRMNVEVSKMLRSFIEKIKKELPAKS